MDLAFVPPPPPHLALNYFVVSPKIPLKKKPLNTKKKKKVCGSSRRISPNLIPSLIHNKPTNKNERPKRFFSIKWRPPAVHREGVKVRNPPETPSNRINTKKKENETKKKNQPTRKAKIKNIMEMTKHPSPPLSIHRRETCCFAWRSRCSTSPPARREWRLFLLQDTFFVVVLVTCVGNDFFLFSPSLSLSPLSRSACGACVSRVPPMGGLPLACYIFTKYEDTTYKPFYIATRAPPGPAPRPSPNDFFNRRPLMVIKRCWKKKKRKEEEEEERNKNYLNANSSSTRRKIRKKKLLQIWRHFFCVCIFSPPSVWWFVWSMCVCVVILLSTMRLNYSNKNTAYFRFTHQTTLIDSKSSPVDDIGIV